MQVSVREDKKMSDGKIIASMQSKAGLIEVKPDITSSGVLVAYVNGREYTRIGKRDARWFGDNYLLGRIRMRRETAMSDDGKALISAVETWFAEDEAMVIAEINADKKWEESIEGFKEIREAINEADKCRWANERQWESESGMVRYHTPKADVKALRAKYPQADAVLKLEAMRNASHYAKSGAGKKWLRRAKSGMDAVEALKEAEAEWSKHAMEHIWD